MAVQQTLKNTVLAKSGALPTATEVVTTNGIVFVNPKIKSGDYDDVGAGTMGTKKTFIDPNYITAEFDIPVQIKKTSALGVAPKLSNLYKFCGLTETIVASTSVAYKPGGITTGTGQVKAYVDGYVKTITGMVGNLKLTGKVGEPLGGTFSVKGFLASAAATAEANPAVTLDTLNAPIVSLVSVVTAGGSTLNADSFDFDLGNDIPSPTYAVGKNEYYIANFDPTLTVTAVKTIGTDESAWTDFAAGTIRAILIQIGTAGGMVELSVPYAMVKDLSEADDSGKVKLTRTFRAQASAGNDNFTLTYK
jgi:hypothetical protein